MNDNHPEPNRAILVEGPAGRGFLVLLLVLVGLLEWMAAGSKFLVGAVRGDLESWRASAVLLGLLGLCYFTLARGLWRFRAWVPLFTALLTLLVLAFSFVRLSQDERPDLAIALVSMLAMFANLGVIGWSLLPGTRDRLNAASASGRAGTS